MNPGVVPPKRQRKRSRVFLARRIVRKVRDHPANADAPNRAVLRACVWQVRKRVTRGPLARRSYGLDLSFPAGSGSLSDLVYFGECFEWENINFIRRYLHPGELVIDVGANIGLFTYATAQATSPDGRVEVFEPLPWAAAVIRENVERNHLAERITVHEIAVADGPGTVRFDSDLDVSSHIEYVAGKSVSRVSVQVRTNTLDAVLPAGPIALAKIDVEGAEALVLEGFRGHLASGNPPVVVLEAHTHSLRKMGSSRSEVFAILAALGYRPHLFEVSSSRLVDVPPDWNADVVAVHAEALEMVQNRLTRP
jgi:FkbM family methyltransferase